MYESHHHLKNLLDVASGEVAGAPMIIFFPEAP